MALKKSDEFLVVIEDIWHNKDSARVSLGEIGKQIKKFCRDYELKPEYEIDYDRYNSDEPYDVGSFGLGFYDIQLVSDDEEYGGRIMIFFL
jgi:hypothetical protein